MNFLELCRRTVEKCGISGSLTSTSGQIGEMLRVVNWVNEAWHDIQLSQSNWDWMRYEFSFQTIAGQQEYTTAQANATLFRQASILRSSFLTGMITDIGVCISLHSINSVLSVGKVY